MRYEDEIIACYAQKAMLTVFAAQMGEERCGAYFTGFRRSRGSGQNACGWECRSGLMTILYFFIFS